MPQWVGDRWGATVQSADTQQVEGGGDQSALSMRSAGPMRGQDGGQVTRDSWSSGNHAWSRLIILPQLRAGCGAGTLVGLVKK